MTTYADKVSWQHILITCLDGMCWQSVLMTCPDTSLLTPTHRLQESRWLRGHGSIMWYLMWNMTDFWGKFSTCPMWTKTPFLNSAASSEFKSEIFGHKFHFFSCFFYVFFFINFCKKTQIFSKCRNFWNFWDFFKVFTIMKNIWPKICQINPWKYFFDHFSLILIIFWKIFACGAWESKNLGCSIYIHFCV